MQVSPGVIHPRLVSYAVIPYRQQVARAVVTPLAFYDCRTTCRALPPSRYQLTPALCIGQL